MLRFVRDKDNGVKVGEDVEQFLSEEGTRPEAEYEAKPEAETGGSAGLD